MWKISLTEFFQFYGLCIWWNAHNTPNQRKIKPPSIYFPFTLYFSLTHNFPFHFSQRSLCKTCVEKLWNGMRTKLKKFHPLQPPQLTNTSTHCRFSLKNNKNEKISLVSSPLTLPNFYECLCGHRHTNTSTKLFFGRLRFFIWSIRPNIFTYEAGEYSLTFLILWSKKKKSRKGKSLISFLQHSKA